MKVSGLRISEFVPHVFLVLVAAAVAVGFWQGIALAVMLLAALAFGLAILLMSSSVRGLSGDTPLSLDEALGLGAPSTEEEQKRAVLRALKDLEYERSVGKISEDDYHEFSARYREDARRLISLVDETMVAGRELAEKLLAERVRAAGLAEADDNGPSAKPATAADAKSSAEEPEESEDTDGPEDTEEPEALADAAPASPKAPARAEAVDGETSCAKCGTMNDADARFCKRCGALVGASPEANAKEERASKENVP